MKMAKASEHDMEAAAVLAGLLTDVDSGYFPRLPDPDAAPDENAPIWFDPDDAEHLRIFYDRIKQVLDRSPGCLGRVIFGFHTLMHNDVVDPDDDCLALHPRIVAALAQQEASKPTAEEATLILLPTEEEARQYGEQSLCPDPLPEACWQVGDIVSRDGNDEQEILSFNEGRDLIEVRCIKEPPAYEGSNEPWCRIGDVEDNLARRYEFVRPGKW